MLEGVGVEHGVRFRGWAVVGGDNVTHGEKAMAWLRRLIVIVLGAILIVDALSAGRFEVVPFTIGLVMVGLVPLDAIIGAVLASPADEADIDRLREVMHERDEGDLS
jgi:hypothetical protein